MSHIANKIDAEDKNLGDLLHNKRFRIDVFQREYKWGRKQMEDLITDVTGNFLKCHRESDQLSDYDNYDCYYMGPVVLCKANKDISIIDGQQRLTSFSLLLIYLHHLIEAENLPLDEVKNLADYIFVRKGGSKTLVLNIEQRAEVMRGLMDSDDVDALLAQADQFELSNRNILERYADIRDMFPESLKHGRSLQSFIDWLLDKVVFVQINAYSMDNAYTIFETMNDRGLNLSPTEILKGFLLSRIIEDGLEGSEKADSANNFWNNRVSALNKTMGGDNSDLEFFKAWFRAKYAETKRQNKAGSENEDFETIGTQFHSWVKNNTSRMGLHSPDDFYYFIKSDLEFFVNLYQKVFKLKKECLPGFEPIYENSFFTIADSLYYPMMLSAVSKLDDENTIDSKIRSIGRFIERYSNIRLLQNKSISQTVIRNNIYDLVKGIRNADLKSLDNVLLDELDRLNTTKPDLRHIKINNQMYLKYLMARLTHASYSKFGMIYPLESYMPSRRKISYVTVAIQEENTEDNIEDLDTAEIANHILIRRTEMDTFKSLRCVWQRVEYIREHNYAPEANSGIIGIEQFFNNRRSHFAQILESQFFRD